MSAIFQIILDQGYEKATPTTTETETCSRSHYIEVVQGAIFMEQNMRFGLILGRLAIGGIQQLRGQEEGEGGSAKNPRLSTQGVGPLNVHVDKNLF